MESFTLDTNCIIDLEDNRPNAKYLRTVVKAWRDGRIKLAVAAVSASENQKDEPASPDFSKFERKLDNIGLSGVHYLLPLAKWDVFYWDHALWSDDEKDILEDRIHSILFPGDKHQPPEDISEYSNWRNHMCDVLTAWSHAYHKWDYLVTRDMNFHNHRIELKDIGVKGILTPEVAARLVTP